MILQFIHRYKHLSLLIVIIFTLFVHPMIQPEEGAIVSYRLFMCLLIASCIMIAEDQRRMLVILALIGIPSIILIGIGASETTEGHSEIELFYVNKFLICCLLGLTIIIVLRDLLRSQVVTRDTLYGAVCGYLLLGLMFALIFLTLSVYDQNSFQNLDNQDTHRLQEDIYFSFVTLTTLGYGDIHPLSTLARQVTWIEAVIGQLYIAMLLARIVAIHTALSFTNKPKE